MRPRSSPISCTNFPVIAAARKRSIASPSRTATSGRADDALAAYTYQVQTYPDGPLRITAELRRGALLFDAGKIADAIAPLQLVADKGTGDNQEIAKYLLGKSFLATQKEADGRALLQGLVDAQPAGKFVGGSAQALAELDDTENKYADAVPLWQKALAAIDRSGHAGHGGGTRRLVRAAGEAAGCRGKTFPDRAAGRHDRR